MKNYKTIVRIVLSRIRKQKNQEWVYKRREICKSCEYNSLFKYDLTIKQRVIKFFSDSYSFLAGKKDEDNLGNCTACEMCSIFYKSAEKEEDCKKNKWIKINLDEINTN